MSLQFLLLRKGRAFDGLGTDWDEIDRALATTDRPLPLLSSIDPYQLRTFSQDDALDLRVECEALLPETTGKAAETLTRLKELATVALSSGEVEFHMVGD